MKDLIINWLKERRNRPQKSVQIAFREAFPDAQGTEWFTLEAGFEAQFTQEGREVIARFTSSGKMLEYQVNRSRDTLPEHISDVGRNYGEVMSLIEIHRLAAVQYEIIIRKPDHSRFLVIADENGDILEKPRQISPQNYPEILPEL